MTRINIAMGEVDTVESMTADANSGTRPNGTLHDEVVSFLASPDAYPPGVDRVERIDTHAAIIFLAGNQAYKIKRPVCYPYLDFSTLEKREAICRHELALNQRTAPEIYRDVVPVVRTADGALRIDGPGDTVEWVLRMHRFDNNQLLSNQVEKGELTPRAAADVVTAMTQWHQGASVVSDDLGAHRFERVIDGLVAFFENALVQNPDLPEQTTIQLFCQASREHFERVAMLLTRRGHQGYVIRGHGDLHLDNIVLNDDRAILFDALEFSDDLATVDVMYELAFLLMDLCMRNRVPSANLVLNEYLQTSERPGNLDALAALPLFMAVRAAVRAMVGLQRLLLTPGDTSPQQRNKTTSYLVFANRLLVAPRQPQLVAVGGFSGTGKSTLARVLAAEIGPPPGAIHLRSDIERKALWQVPALTRLPAQAYQPQQSQQVYDRLCDKAIRSLRAGHSVIIDAVFAKASERSRMQGLASENDADFCGLWLTADEAVMCDRIRHRRNDASDATEQVLATQVQRGAGDVAWPQVDAGGSPAQTVQHARDILAGA